MRQRNILAAVIALSIITAVVLFVVGIDNTQLAPIKGIVGLAPDCPKPAPSVVYHNTIASICKLEKKAPSECNLWFPGMVLVTFKKELPVPAIRKYLADNGYEVLDDSDIQEPTTVKTWWSKKFYNEHVISIEEVNTFLTTIRNKSYVTSVEVPNLWHTYPYDAINTDDVQKIERWGYFTVTLSALVEKERFLKENPNATFVRDGRIYDDPGTGTGSKKASGNEIIILYKAKNVMRVLNSIATTAKLQDFKLNTWEEKMSINVGREIELNFESSYTNDDIRKLLSKYPEIDLAKTTIEERSNYLTMRVPIDEEWCWARELQKEPIIKWVGTNFKSSASFN